MRRAGTWRTWSLAAAAAAVLGWTVAPLPEPAPALVKPRQDGWRLPPLPRRVDQTSTAAMVSGANYWGAPVAVPATAGATPPADPRWRVAAVYGRGPARGVLVVFAAPGKPAQQLAVGDALPSGHRIVSIGERDLCVQIGKKAYRLGVERSAP